MYNQKPRGSGESRRPQSVHTSNYSGNFSPSRVSGEDFMKQSRPSEGGRNSFRTNTYSRTPNNSSFRSGSRGNFGSRGPRRSSRANQGERIDYARFINKTVVTEEAQVFTPEHLFADFQIEQRLKDAISKRGYVQPTPIQDKSIPHVLKGEDIVGIANTGTGKTGAFLIPLINKVLLNPKEKIMVVVPTRELALQIDQELKSLVFGMKIFSVCCVGGVNIFGQIRDLRYHNNFIIGTPGRLKDLIDRKKIFLNEFNTLVLDEADRMLDMGFINDIRFICAGFPTPRQTLFFSATLSPEIEKLIHEFLNNPVKISVKTQDTSKNVEQDVIKVSRDQNKVDVLKDLLSQEEFSKVIVFGRTKHGVERLSRDLAHKGISAASIHGDKSHGQRQNALRSFKQNQIKVLVATDVAARGLDIPDVTHVINYDLPATYDDYVHRIGRTGRGTKRGKALTFVG